MVFCETLAGDPRLMSPLLRVAQVLDDWATPFPFLESRHFSIQSTSLHFASFHPRLSQLLSSRAF
jgi:hypothetical protein